ncbi:hypothetical protein HYH03_012990 [Edaphochlamys debaryana]|uniref:BRISC and BRCA1-A complex member 2 n=1 Tax=Edaphochlamys debaryana TaxID=47281 RepID=A0A836BTF4_9CHLO|nr:hypothetical protein HYH03_012990 [Edaphochlamys debaryana]|eukprot:KAG2488486.1 hypothetical protein HYH03_012990 [Edaphochlamys debaryana]
MRWQLILPSAGGGAPDLIFDDETFRPLCPPPALAAGLGSADAGAGGAGLRSQLKGWASDPQPGRPERLTQLVAPLLDAYRRHHVARISAVAARLPRLQFELSTLDLEGGAAGSAVEGAGVQAELTANAAGQLQACFAVPLPAVSLRPLLELASAFVGRPLLPPLPGARPAAAPQAQPGAAAGRESSSGGADALVQGALQGGLIQAAAAAAGGVGAADKLAAAGLGPGAGSAAGIEPRLSASGSAPAPTAALVAAAAAAAVAAQRRLAAATTLVLLAIFRLPSGGTDLGEPELSLQLPPALLELQALSAPSSSTAPASSTPASTSSSGTPASSFPPGPSASPPGAPRCAVPLLPPLLLPPWSAHMCLAEFVPLAGERLAAQAEAHCAGLAARQQLVAHLTEALGTCLESNLPGGAALFSCAWEGAPVLVTLELGPRFPADKPAITLHSARQLSAPDAARTYREYPWSPRWAPREMAARIHNWLLEELPSFMRGRAPPP